MMRYQCNVLVLLLLFVLSLASCTGDVEQADMTQGNDIMVSPTGGPALGCEEVGGCRVTGGGVDLNGNWDGSFEKGSNNRDRYEFGGQAGANTAMQPRPKGEWTHHQQHGPSGSFVFHAGTASAPEGTMIEWVRCSDPGFCDPARHAPAKQVDFRGYGTFKNMKNVPDIIADNVVVGVTLHYFVVNIDDCGEPGHTGKLDISGCPDQGFGSQGGADYVDCDCPDFYRITIYADMSDSEIIYQVYGYIKGGNLQVHPPTGFDE
jgi:hypothetical protein